MTQSNFSRVKQAAIPSALLAFTTATSLFAAPAARAATIKIDGSSTVFSITEAVAEEFGKSKKGKGTKVTIGVSGTGGEFKKFCVGATHISNTFRFIKDK